MTRAQRGGRSCAACGTVTGVSGQRSVTGLRTATAALAAGAVALMCSHGRSAADPDPAAAPARPPATAPVSPAEPARSQQPPTASPGASQPAAPTSEPARSPVAQPMMPQVIAPPRDDDGPIRLSLPTTEDRELWQHSGFRLGLGALYGQLRGSGSVMDLTLKGVTIRPGIRLDSRWGLYLPVEYAVTDRNGAQFAATVEPTWYATPNIAFALGLGYAGLIGVSEFVSSPPEQAFGQIGQSYTFPDASTPLSRCDGYGVVGLGRMELGYVLGPRSRTHLALEAIGQWTGCELNNGGKDRYSGMEYVLRQWWGHTGFTVSWGIEWR